MGGRCIAVAALTLTISLALSGTAAAAPRGYEEPTREEWVRQADRICEQPYKRGNRLVDRFEKLAERERWGPAGRILNRLGKIVLRVTDEVEELARPPADDEAIQVFVDGEQRGARLHKKAGRVLKREKVRKAAKLLDRSDRASTQAHRAVEDFGLRHCA
jgi:hypothetical protein